MMGADAETFSQKEAKELAQELYNRQLMGLREAVTKVTSDDAMQPLAAVLSGEGEFLARRLMVDTKVISLAEELGPEISKSACAYAAANRAQESMVRQPGRLV